MKIDLHTHTRYSDGKEDPKIMISYAKKLGIYIAITDHDTSKGISEEIRKLVIPGEEVTTQYGHVVILCNFPPNPPNDIKSLVDYSKENSCIIFPSHPFDIFRKGIGNHVFEYKFDAIEIFNSKAPKKANEKAYNAAKELKLPGFANSDSHVKESIGSAYNEIELSEFDIDDILEILRKGDIRPVGKGLSITAKLKIIQWYIERKI
ncbi:PHP domain-containing protein [Acidianus sulfidivorans JP7]|uniref:Phosphoesterase n=1 Tax=Acidianus sulfidivorans JP7 TaxID=619593 RepID=A0A2U9IP63_9CREN|nr:PHP domain-containing protein [Acidianus sulfidivorans]AWR97776.1 PHP domain-containing protein [Acidianus sulfidivorans JP7]